MSGTPTGGGYAGNGRNSTSRAGSGNSTGSGTGDCTVAVGVAARQVQCSIETHVLCNARTHHNVLHSVCI